jgi:hypothetical protein
LFENSSFDSNFIKIARMGVSQDKIQRLQLMKNDIKSSLKKLTKGSSRTVLFKIMGKNRNNQF